MDFIGNGIGNDYKETRERGGAILREATLKCRLTIKKIAYKSAYIRALIRFTTGPTPGEKMLQDDP
jgi:hypothetical protein